MSIYNRTEQELLNGKSTAPGRVRTFLLHSEQHTTPHSCTRYEWDGNLGDLLAFASRALKGGSGVKITFPTNTKLEQPRDLGNWKVWIDENHPERKSIEKYEMIASSEDRLSGSFHIFKIEDSIEGLSGILDSWESLIDLADWNNIILDFSNIRAAGTQNSNGLIASGAESFLTIYLALASYLESGTIGNLLKLLGTLNHVMRRGGYKKGIITSAMSSECALIKDYLKVPIVEVEGSHKKGVILYESVFENPHLIDLIVESRNNESTFIEKPCAHGLAFNVCVTADTWIKTSEGAKKVSELVGKPFEAMVNGQAYSSTDRGFWSNGIKDVVRLKTKEGYELKLTPNHKVIRLTRPNYHTKYSQEWVECGILKKGDKIQLNNSKQNPKWEGKGTHGQGWILGQLLGNGWFTNTQGTLAFFGEHRNELFNRAVELVKSELGLATYGGRQYSIGASDNEKHVTDNGRDYKVKSFSSKLVGLLAADYGITKQNKIATAAIESASFDFCTGFIQGLFDADSHVRVGQKDGSGKSIQFSQSSLETIEVVHRILLRMGIKSTIYKARPNRIARILPGCSKPSAFKQSYRLDITGGNISQYAALIGFSKPDKIKALNEIESNRKRNSHNEQFGATVESVEPYGQAEVYDCTINEIHCFDANGIIAHNCVGLELGHKATCLIWRINLGMCRIDEIVGAYTQAALDACELHTTWRDQVPELAAYYAPLIEDRQIGLDVMGLANLLAIEGVTYLDFADALEHMLIHNYSPKMDDKPLNATALEIAYQIIEGYRSATITCDRYMQSKGLPILDRIFTVEPAQNHAYETFDRVGKTTCRGIFAPVGRIVNPVATTGRESKRYFHGSVETDGEIGAKLHERLCDLWQKTMDSTGRAHAISQDSWREMTPELLRDFAIARPSRTLYYAEAANYNQNNFLAKTIQDVEVCSIDRDGECEACAG